MTALEQLFLDVVNLSVTASWVIAVVLVLRLILKPVPKKYVCLLWLVVLFRLLCPVTLESEFSLVPQHEEIKYEIVYTTPQIETPSKSVNAVANQTVNPILEQTSAPNPQGSVNPLQVYIFLAAWLWVMGIAVLCGYTLFSWVRMRHQLAEAVPDGGGVYLSDRITSPFVFGIVRPRIYLPCGLATEAQHWVLLHEQSHIARRDHLVKPLFWLAVILHWMNPLVWIAWHFYSRDVELACDERAIDNLDTIARCQYGDTLVHLAVQPKKLRCPVAFGNHSIKQRIRHVLQYKNIAAGLAAGALMLVVLMMAALGVDPVQSGTLGQFESKLLEDYPYGINTVSIKYGGVRVSINDAAQAEELRRQLAELRVQEVRNQGYEGDTGVSITISGVQEQTYHEETLETDITLDGCSIHVSNDLTMIDGAHPLKVKEPEKLKRLLLSYCAQELQNASISAFHADLNHDGTDEWILVDVSLWDNAQTGQADLAVYLEDETLLFYDYLTGAHADWENYFLCEKDGKDYLLAFCPTMYQGYATYSWKLMDFDANNELRIVEEDSIDFSVNPVVTEETQQFDIDAILAFLEGAERMIRPAMLLVSTEDGVLEYSTTEQFRTRTAESYITWWLEDNAAYQALSAQEKATVSLREKLQMKQNELLSAGSQVQLEQLADQWAQTFADRDGTGRYDLMTSDLQQQVDRASAADTSQWWMPVWVDSKDREKGMFLRGSSPWVESWDTTLQLEDDATKAQIQIRYDMTDSAEARYVYGETLQCVRQEQTWKVADCTISVELMEQIK